MVLLFPTTDALVDAIRSGHFPASILSTPGRGAIRADGSVLFMPHRPNIELAALGAMTVVADEPAELSLPPIASPLELLGGTSGDPLEPVTGTVLFECASPGQVTRLLRELRRTGHPAEAFQWPDRKSGMGYLVHAVQSGPAIALWAADRGIPRFVERTPRVWVEVGSTPALLEWIQPPRGQRLFIRPGRPWRSSWHRPLQRVENRPGNPGAIARQHPAWVDRSTLPHVALRLHFRRRTQKVPAAELWLIDEKAVERLRQLLEVSSEAVAEDLEFAITARHAVEAVWLRASAAARSAPTLMIDAIACAPVARLPDLFAPAGVELRPALRRDFLRARFTHPNRITCLRPLPDGELSPVTVRADAFRPLIQFVNYTVPRALWRRTPLAIGRGPFEFESFTAPPVRAVETAAPDHTGTAPPQQRPERSLSRPEVQAVRGTAPNVAVASDESPRPEDVGKSPASPDDALDRLIALQTQFLALGGPLDTPVRARLWPELARLYPRIGDVAEAALCWANACWQHESPPQPWISQWFREEWGNRSPQQVEQGVAALLREPTPATTAVRQLAVWMLHRTFQRDSLERVRPLLAQVARHLAEHDWKLPIRITWLTWVAIARSGDNDILALSRARDRILAQLLESGVHRDRDLPSFLRSPTGPQDALHRVDAGRLRGLHERALTWAARDGQLATLLPRSPLTKVGISLTFAYGIARLGEPDACRRFLRDLRELIATEGQGFARRPGLSQQLDVSGRWLCDAYLERIRQMIDNRPAQTPLPRQLTRALDALPAPERQRVDRFRQFSRILEPHERADPYRNIRVFGSDLLAKSLSDLPTIQNAERIEQSVRALLKANPQNVRALRILAAAMPLAYRTGDSFALELLSQVRPTIEARSASFLDAAMLIQCVQLVETALGVAAHHDRLNMVEDLVAVLHRLLEGLEGERAAWLITALSGQSFRNLARLGLRDIAFDLFSRLARAVTRGVPIREMMRAPALNRGVCLPALLRLAGGWFYFDAPDVGAEVIDGIRADLFTGPMSPEPRVALACAYAAALGHAPVALALPAFDELFAKLPLPFFGGIDEAVARIRVVEAVILSMSGDDFRVDSSGRHLLDEEEYLIRRRLHRDMRQALASAGL